MSDFIKELVSSLKKTSTERISNPFYGVFMVTWLVYNWEGVAIMIFSDMKMQERVRFINSAYPFMYILPFCTAVFLTFVLPWCTEKITFFQSKPLSRTSSLLAIRKKRMLISDISVERYRAKKDVAYERYKVGAEKEVQDMKERIILSTERTGELTASLKESQDQVFKLKKEINSLNKVNSELQIEKANSEDLYEKLLKSEEILKGYIAQMEEYKEDRSKLEAELGVLIAHNSDLAKNYPMIFEKKGSNNRLLLKSQAVSALKKVENEKNIESVYPEIELGKTIKESVEEYFKAYPYQKKEVTNSTIDEFLAAHPEVKFNK